MRTSAHKHTHTHMKYNSTAGGTNLAGNMHARPGSRIQVYTLADNAQFWKSLETQNNNLLSYVTGVGKALTKSEKWLERQSGNKDAFMSWSASTIQNGVDSQRTERM